MDTSSEEWRIECLVRHICRLPTSLERRGFLKKMAEIHGAEAVKPIEEAVKNEWERRQTDLR